MLKLFIVYLTITKHAQSIILSPLIYHFISCSYYISFYLILSHVISHFISCCISFYLMLYLILSHVISHFISCYISFYLMLYLILSHVVSHFISCCISFYLMLYLILSQIISLYIEWYLILSQKAILLSIRFAISSSPHLSALILRKSRSFPAVRDPSTLSEFQLDFAWDRTRLSSIFLIFQIMLWYPHEWLKWTLFKLLLIFIFMLWVPINKLFICFLLC